MFFILNVHGFNILNLNIHFKTRSVGNFIAMVLEKRLLFTLKKRVHEAIYTNNLESPSPN